VGVTKTLAARLDMPLANINKFETALHLDDVAHDLARTRS
jgi:hypothetical protein